jgi:hypothetical protein
MFKWSRVFNDDEAAKLWNRSDVLHYDNIDTNPTAKNIRPYPAAFEIITPNSLLTYSEQSSAIDGMRAYWPFDETSGTRKSVHQNTTFDLTPWTSGVSYTSTAKQGNAVSLTDTQFGFLENLSAGIDFTSDWSIAGWFKVDTVVSTDRFNIVFIGITGASAQYFYLDTYGTDLRLYVYHTGGFQGDATAYTVAAGTWYHAAVRFDADGSTNGRLQLYINGSLASTLDLSGTWPTNTMNCIRFGRGNNSTNRYMDGKLDEWALWDRLLTTDEISELYASGTGVSYGDLIS